MNATKLVIVLGANDVGSAVALTLWRDHFYHVVIVESPTATATRRGQSFVDAVWTGSSKLLDVECRVVEDVEAEREGSSFLPMLVEPHWPKKHAPSIIIDCRMRKHDTSVSSLRGRAPLTIGLGPNFVAGENVDIAIETGWDKLGQIVWKGPTDPLAGEPREIEGHSRDRYIYAPVAGIFKAAPGVMIGSRVEQGQEVARICDTILTSPLSGYVRGLTRDSVEVRVKTKCFEVDPRDKDKAQIYGISQRPRTIAEGVCEALKQQQEKDF